MKVSPGLNDRHNRGAQLGNPEYRYIIESEDLFGTGLFGKQNRGTLQAEEKAWAKYLQEMKAKRRPSIQSMSMP